MTCKQFFKSTAFKCIMVLVCIALVSGGLLAILNDVWSVSDDEQINRAIKEVCGDGVTLNKEIELDPAYATEDGSIDKVYYLSNDSYLLTVTGNKGYHSGSVSLYILAKSVDGSYEIETASIASYSSSQTLMSKFSSSSLSSFISNDSYIEGGASYSSKAVRNAINTARDFLENDLADLA